MRQTSTNLLLALYMVKGSHLVTFTRKRPPLYMWVWIINYMIALDVLGNEESYLPVTGGR